MADSDIVSTWYSDDDIVYDMKENVRVRLKKWEVEVVSEYFPQNANILDVGCGTGREAFSLFDKGFSVTGVDISEKIIREAKLLALESKRDIEFIQTNGTDLPFESNVFDVVIIWAQTLGLIYGNEQQISFLSECRRVMKNGGIISFSGHDRMFLETGYIDYLRGKNFFPFKNSAIYWEMFTENELSDLAQNSGFTVIKIAHGEIYTPDDGVILHCVCKN